ncbi:hypothetical protein JD969_15105 [Planctomycetota bacterium]|nr:hypothetical protein JD969_15105 [Planctomycetota bacterium]
MNIEFSKQKLINAAQKTWTVARQAKNKIGYGLGAGAAMIYGSNAVHAEGGETLTLPDLGFSSEAIATKATTEMGLVVKILLLAGIVIGVGWFVLRNFKKAGR